MREEMMLNRIHIVLFVFGLGLNVTVSEASQGFIYWAEINRIGISKSNLKNPVKTPIPIDTSNGAGLGVDLVNQKIYWLTNRNQATLRRSNLDGTELETLLHFGDIENSDMQLDVAGGKIYWLSETAVNRANLDGSGVEELISGIGNTQSIDLDLTNNHIYFVANQDIIRADLDGSNQTIIRDNLLNTNLVVVDEVNSQLYFGNGANNIGLRRSDLDGQNQVTIFNQPAVSGLQIIGSNLYIQSVNAIRRNIVVTDLDGNNEQPFLTLGIDYSMSDFYIDLPNNTVYMEIGSGQSQQLVTTDISGNNAINLMATMVDFHDLAVIPDSGTLIVGDTQTSNIAIAKPDGTDVFNLVADLGAENNRIFGIAYDEVNERIYWVEVESGVIGRIDLDGGNRADLITGLTRPSDLAIDPANDVIYWTENTAQAGTTGMIRTADLDGNGVSDVITGVSNGIRGIDLDRNNNRLYFTDLDNDQIWRVDVDGNNLTPIAASVDPHDVAVDHVTNTLYWSEGIDDDNDPTGVIRCSDLDGNNPADFMTGLSDYIRDITVVYLASDVIYADGFEPLSPCFNINN